MTEIEFPDMRANVVAAVESLSNPEYQRAQWLNPDAFDNLDLAIHMLYDDSAVLPNPEDSVGVILQESDVKVLEDISAVLTPMVDELGDVSDQDYLDDPRWVSVVQAAQVALKVMTSGGSG